MIGYTRGDGGFQWENAMGDLAIGVVGVMAYWFRGHFWLATIVVLTVQYFGDTDTSRRAGRRCGTSVCPTATPI